MAIDKILGAGDLDSVADSVFSAVNNSVSEIKAMQKRKAAENVQIVVQALKKIEADLRGEYGDVADKLAERITSIKDGQDGRNGADGRNGKDGRPGRDGLQGAKGNDGLLGRDGVDGVDGVSVTNAFIDFDGSLIINLSNGQSLNVGEVVAPDLAERIKVISTMSTNAAVVISDEGVAISPGVKNINFVGATVTATASGDDVTVNVSAGTGTVTSVAVSGGTTGLTTSGGPITTTGTITLAGTLAASNGGTGLTALGTGVATFLATPSSANLAAAVTNETGTGALVFATSPTLVTPDLGTPSALVGTNITGTATAFTASNVTTNANLTGAITSTGNATLLGSFTSAALAAALTDETGSGANVFATSPTLVTPALGTPSSATLTNATGLPIATGVSGLGFNVVTFLATPSSANLRTAVTDETGTGALVFATSPTLVTPALGTPSALVGTNITGTATSFTSSNVTTNANLTGSVTSVGNATTVVTNANLTGDVTSVGNATTLTNAPVIAKVLTGYASGAGTVAATDSILQAIQKLNGNDATNANLTGAVTSVGNATSLGSFTSAQLAGALTNETGSGSAVFATSPTLVTPALGTPSSAVLTNATGLPIATGVSGLGTGVATALAVNIGTAGAPVVNGGVLGTPSSGVVTNLTGTASININGTVGATTPATGSFTSLAYSTTLTGGTGVVNLGSGQFFKDASGNVGIGTSTIGSAGVTLTSAYNIGWGQSAGESIPNIFRQSSSAATVLANGYRNSATANGFASSFSSSFAKSAIALNDGTVRFFTDTAATTAAGTDVTPTERMRIDSSGGLILVGSTAQKATGTTWSNPSDERLKDNIRDYGKGLAELMQVRVREWEYNGKGGTVEGTKGLGVVADEVMVVLPDTVENYEAKLNADDEEVTAIKKFDATEITWLLVKAVQELKAINDAQAQTIESLTARVVALEQA